MENTQMVNTTELEKHIKALKDTINYFKFEEDISSDTISHLEGLHDFCINFLLQ